MFQRLLCQAGSGGRRFAFPPYGVGRCSFVRLGGLFLCPDLRISGGARSGCRGWPQATARGSHRASAMGGRSGAARFVDGREHGGRVARERREKAMGYATLTHPTSLFDSVRQSLKWFSGSSISEIPEPICRKLFSGSSLSSNFRRTLSILLASLARSSTALL